MPESQVVIFSSHSLFREGLKRILADVPSVNLAGYAQTAEEIEELALLCKPDFIIVEKIEDDPLHAEHVARLLTIPDIRLLAVSLDDSEIQIYRRDLFGEATAEKLIALLTKADI